MTALSVAEGLAQIDALTAGVDLPMPALRSYQVDVIVDSLRDAWSKVKASNPTYASTSNEASLNLFMETELKLQLANGGILGLLASAISRGSETPTHNGQLIEKRPDINIHRSGGEYSRFPITVECKIIDGVDRTIKKYCDDGVHRYVDGHYGWAQSDGFMLAYVRDGSTIGTGLVAALGGDNPYATLDFPDPDPPPSEIGRSRHDRSFTYPTKKHPNNVPGPIRLTHLWLS